jgi:hypothetical protein
MVNTLIIGRYIDRTIERAFFLRLHTTCDVICSQIKKRLPQDPLAEMMIKLFDLDLEPVFTEFRRGDIVSSLADISRLKNVLDLGLSSEIEPCLKQIFKH